MELVAEFLDFFFHLMIGAGIYYFVRSLLLRYEASLNEEVDDLKEKLRKMIHFVKLERHGDQLYWFDAQTDQFLGQGQTLDEVIAHVKSRFPTHVFVDESSNAFLKAPEWKPLPISDLKKLNAVD
jgi:hypothetical protein